MFFKKTAFILFCIGCSALSAMTKDFGFRSHSKFVTPEKLMLEQVSLDYLIELALSRNPGLREAAERVTAAGTFVSQAQAAMKPTVVLSGDLSRVEALSRNRGGLGGDESTGIEFRGDFSWLLYSGNRLEYLAQSAKSGELATMAARQEAQRLLRQAVVNAYFFVLLSDEQLNVAKNDATFNQTMLGDMRQLFENGLGKREDVLNFEIRQIMAEQKIVQNRANGETARKVLAQLVGIVDLDLSESQFIFPTETKLLYEDVDQAISQAFLLRPDLHLAAHKLDSLRAAKKAADAGRSPIVSARASAGLAWDLEDGLDLGNDWNVSLGLNVSWKAFDGGAINAGKLAAASEVLQQQWNIQLMRINIASEVRQAYVKYAAANDQWELVLRLQGLAQERRDLVKDEYEAGRANSTRLNEAQNDLVQAESAMAQVKIGRILALYELESMIGEKSQ